MSTINLKHYDLARVKLNLSEADAKEFVQVIDELLLEEKTAAVNTYKGFWKEDFSYFEQENYRK